MNNELEDLTGRPVDTETQDIVADTRKQAWRALAGCAILQLPIWGIAMTFGIFQEAYTRSHVISGGSASGIIGTTMNGVMYLSMPLLFTALDRSWAQYRRSVAIAGIVISSLAFLVSSWSTQLWHLVLTQGVLAALGSTLLYSPTTLYLDEHFTAGKATVYGAILSSKNIVGSCCPLILTALLEKLGFRWTLRIWAAVVLCTGTIGIAIIPTKTSPSSQLTRGDRKVPWTFLRHKTIWIYSFANAVFSCGYGIPQTYLPSYARDVLKLSTLSSSLMITLFNAPGIISCVGFGLLSDKAKVSSTTNTFISAAGTSLSAFLLWGLSSNRIEGVLIAFSLLCGFFAGGYSSTWGGWIKDLEQEAVARNEAIDTGMLYGLFNGARGVGYVISGVAGVELLQVGSVQENMRWGYGTKYGALILFTGVSAVVGGWSVLWRYHSRPSVG
ncbi:MFS-type transporter pynF [Fulvia fulva]|uniref:MFS-type transporter pynF n=1 Tax=Passalora fulva TaxID=5499 RepID=A0A9Q8PMK1_PASFU|nr:MFS-type transporter pynF [Fulvia fulva]KAK4609462.1 MFS-type transporter pynF [Fulvia fulva]KAK4609978.1 MFS-type transporter pynF [Fulvia fulva]UJO25183.1 MFS-type transporter pynF [Fulvia fulva]WPV22515.1 MFS-type transporter pynF [Fulvia fulva]WPV37838.1 MFS-type transporter pynF [Fulvia fulva]